MELECLVTALYLPRDPLSSSVAGRRWQAVIQCLRESSASLSSAPRELRQAGFWEEALSLESPGQLQWAELQVESGHVACITGQDYPSRWREALGIAAPPCLWRQGEIRGRWIAVVGSRKPDVWHRRFVEAIVDEAAALGYGIVSGGAYGIDDAARKACSRRGVPCLEIHPCGLVRRGKQSPWAAHLSAYAPGSGFTGRQAMARNALIYAAAEFAVAVHPRYKEGGTWHGAVEAHRRKLTRIAVLEEPDHLAVRALRGIGLYGIRDAKELCLLIRLAEAQGSLFAC